MINLNDPDDNLLVETLFGILPYVAQSEPRSALVIGFGGGITTNALARTDLQHIDVVELEPVIIEANRTVHNPHAEALNDSRVSLRINDARNDLIIRADRYDIIAAQPSHPWLARASNVFIQEFWELARKRLTPSGVFAQWVNLFNMDATTLRSVLKAFFGVFPHGCTFVDLNSGDLILLGSNTPIKLNMTRVDSLISSAAFQATLSAYNIRDSRDLLWYFGLSRKNALHAAGNAPPNSDTNILSEVRLSALVSQPKGDEDVVAFIKTHYRADFAQYIDTADVTQLNYQQALHFAAGNYYFLANTLAQRLDVTDARLARSVRYEILWRQFDYEAAFALYTAEHDWPARVHLLQALAWLTLQHLTEAFATLARIDDPREYRGAHARLLFETDDWEQLAALQPKSDGERRWYLATTAQQDAVSAGTQIESLLRTQDTPVALLRVMVRHASLANDAAELARWSRRLAKTVDGELLRAGALGTQAIDSANFTKAKVILSYMEKLDPDARAVHSLRWRLNRQ